MTAPRILILFGLGVSFLTCGLDAGAGIEKVGLVELNHFTSKDGAPSLLVSTLYGTVTVEEPVLLELFESSELRRLQFLRQHSIEYFTQNQVSYNRFEHSVGVFCLVRRFGASLKEQIASLLHDVSHTPFSHVGAFYFSSDPKKMDAFQDTIHENFLRNSSLATILHKYGFLVEEVLPTNPLFSRLERHLPDICADRFEYNVTGGVYEGLITAEEAAFIVAHLRYADRTDGQGHALACSATAGWFFDDIKAAQLFARLPLFMTEHVWGGVVSCVTGPWLGAALRRAVTCGVLNEEVVLNSTDDAVWNLLVSSDDVELQGYTKKIIHAEDYCCVDEQNPEVVMHGKFRGVDPLVCVGNEWKRLSVLDSSFKDEFARVARVMSCGWSVRFVEP